MKTGMVINKKNTLEASTQGALMVYNPITKLEEHEIIKWAAQQKAAAKAKQAKSKVSNN